MGSTPAVRTQEGTWKFPYTLTCVVQESTWKFLCTLLMCNAAGCDMEISMHLKMYSAGFLFTCVTFGRNRALGDKSLHRELLCCKI